MAHDVFISYSTKDKTVADAVCAYLESAGIRCWIAPRDIQPGQDWGATIIEAIEGSKAMVLLFSSNANESQQIKREVERAVHKGLALIPFRIENVPPSKSLEYFISTPHWLDALTPPLESHLRQLQQTVNAIISVNRGNDAPKPIPYASAPSPIRRWQPLLVVAATTLGMIVLATSVMLFRKSAAPPAVATPVTIPTAAPLNPTPQVGSRQPQSEETANLVDDLEKLDRRIARERELLADLDPRAIKEETPYQVHDELDISATDSKMIHLIWNDFDRVRALGELGAPEPMVRTAIEALRSAIEAEAKLVAKIESISLTNRLADIAAKEGLPRDPSGDEPKLLRNALTAARTGFEVRIKIAYLQALRIAAAIRPALPNDTEYRLLKLTHVSPATLRDASKLDEVQKELDAALQAADRDVIAAKQGLSDFTQKAVGRLAEVISPASRPQAFDSETAVVTASRALRTSGDSRAAMAVLASYAELTAPADVTVENYYRTAVKYAVYAAKKPAAGLYVYDTPGQRGMTMDGIATGDILLTYNGKSLIEPTDLVDAIKAAAGQPGRLELLRIDESGNFIRLTRTASTGDPGVAARPI